MPNIVENCFICTTPLQIINAMSLAFHSKDQSDLYVVPQFLDASKYVERLRKTHIFREVSEVNTDTIEAYKKHSNKILIYGGLIRNYLRVSSIAQQILLPNTEYSRVFISSKANIGRLVCLYYIRKFPGAKICYFDDGEGSYDNTRLYQPTGKDATIRRILFGKRALELSDTIYLYSPELYHKLNPNSKMLVSRLPSWNSSSELLRYINEVCDYTEEKSISQKVIFLDTISTDIFEYEMCEQYKKLRRGLIELFKEDIIIKKHPRDLESAECAEYPYKDIPFEVICANNDIGNKLLVSLASTAVSMPKILFDANVSVLLLYKIFPPKCGNDEERDRFYQAIQKRYPDKEKFCIPESEDILFKVCKAFRKKL